MHKMKLVLLLMFWIAILICIIKVPAVGVVTAIAALIFTGYKKASHIPIGRIRRK